jgi:hypothetical protein
MVSVIFCVSAFFSSLRAIGDPLYQILLISVQMHVVFGTVMEIFYLIFSDILSQSGRTTFHMIQIEKHAVQRYVYQIISIHN